MALSLLFVKCQKHPMTSSWETLSHLMSGWLMLKALVKVMVKARLQHSMTPLQLPSQEHHRRQLVYPAHPLQDVKPNEYYQTDDRIKSDQLSRTSLSRFSNVRSHNLPTGSTQQRRIAAACGLTMSMPGRHVTAQVREFSSRSIRCSLARSIRMRRTTPRLLFQAFCRTLTTTLWGLMTRLWRTSIGPWMTTGTQSLSHQSSLRVTCRSFCLLQIVMSSGGSEPKQQALRSQQLGETSEVQEPLLRPRSSVTDKVSRSMS